MGDGRRCISGTGLSDNLLKYIGKDAGVCIPSRSDGRYEDEVVVGINLKSAFRYAEKRKNVIRGGNLTQDYVEVVDMPFEGPLFTREIVEKIGVPDKNYIILYDDSDYSFYSFIRRKLESKTPVSDLYGSRTDPAGAGPQKVFQYQSNLAGIP